MKRDGGDAAPEEELTVFQRNDPLINGTLSSFLTSAASPPISPSWNTTNQSSHYQDGISLLEVLRRPPGNRNADANSEDPDNPPDTAHVSLAIEGGGMRGAVSAGMAAAIATLDLADGFDSVCGSSAGAIVGAYLVSRQLCTDVYTDIMPAAKGRFASRSRGAINFGVDFLGDLFARNSVEEKAAAEREEEDEGGDGLCSTSPEVDGSVDYVPGSVDGTPSLCEEDLVSSVELAMAAETEESDVGGGGGRPSRWTDDHYDGIIYESVTHVLSRASSFFSSSVLRPLLDNLRLPAASQSAFDAASSLRQYLRFKPGMNLTFILDGIMDEAHGLRPFDVEAFRNNDAKQPLYVVASAVSEGGAGGMETVAFNSKEGDYFGLFEEEEKERDGRGGGGVGDISGRLSWYRRAWDLFGRVPRWLLSRTLLRASSTTATADVRPPPLPGEDGTPSLLPGTSAMYGLGRFRRTKKRKISPQTVTKFYEATGRVVDGSNDIEEAKGLFPCLAASMLVPGAAGPPIRLLRSKNRRFTEDEDKDDDEESAGSGRRRKRRRGLRPMSPGGIGAAARASASEVAHLCYDAFCYEPIPYRSAVERAGATHVLALRSRPDGCVVETRQHMYERIVGPIYFRKHGMNQVAKLFSTGGSQYRYIEDVLTLDEGLARGISNNNGSSSDGGVLIPPTRILYGTDKDDEIVHDMENWKRAHLLPITIPFGTPELPTLTQDRAEVIKAVRHGYAAAFDVLAPIAGLPFDSRTIPGDRVALLLFPDPVGDDDVAILDTRVKVKPTYIGGNGGGEDENEKRRGFAAWITGKREARRRTQEEIVAHPDGALARMVERRTSMYHESDQYVRDGGNTLEWLEMEALLAALPGFRGGRLDHIADGLLSASEKKKREN